MKLSDFVSGTMTVLVVLFTATAVFAWFLLRVCVTYIKYNLILAIEAEALRRENLRAERYNAAQLDRRD